MSGKSSPSSQSSGFHGVYLGWLMTVACSAYVADEYWPQDIVTVGALDVMEMYRNALFLEGLGVEGSGGCEVVGVPGGDVQMGGGNAVMETGPVHAHDQLKGADSHERAELAMAVLDTEGQVKGG